MSYAGSSLRWLVDACLISLCPSHPLLAPHLQLDALAFLLLMAMVASFYWKLPRALWIQELSAGDKAVGLCGLLVASALLVLAPDW